MTAIDLLMLDKQRIERIPLGFIKQIKDDLEKQFNKLTRIERETIDQHLSANDGDVAAKETPSS